MDLWIRSQNKEQLLKIERDITITDSEKYKKMFNLLDINIMSSDYDKVDGIDVIRSISNTECYLLTTDKLLLGTYNSKERALEVLDEVQNAILGIIILEDIEEIKLKKYTGSGILSKKSNNIVYEMPKE